MPHNADGCLNCGVLKSPCWRNGLCNACGLFKQKHGRHRSVSHRGGTKYPRHHGTKEANQYTASTSTTSSKKKSKYTGVTFNRSEGRFKAYIYINSKQVSLGSHSDEEDAARAYDAAVRQHRGRGSAVNFPLAGSGETQAEKRFGKPRGARPKPHARRGPLKTIAPQRSVHRQGPPANLSASAAFRTICAVSEGTLADPGGLLDKLEQEHQPPPPRPSIPKGWRAALKRGDAVDVLDDDAFVWRKGTVVDIGLQNIHGDGSVTVRLEPAHPGARAKSLFFSRASTRLAHVNERLSSCPARGAAADAACYARLFDGAKAPPADGASMATEFAAFREKRAAAAGGDGGEADDEGGDSAAEAAGPG